MTCNYIQQSLEFYTLMKQKINNSQGEDSSNISLSKKEKLDRKRMIKKSKLQLNLSQCKDLKSIDTSTLTREQKAMLQKAKNREAAQKSRDMHKQYVVNLQKELQQLKQSWISSRKLCSKCQRELDQLSNHQSSSDQHTDERSKEQKTFSFQPDQVYNQPSQNPLQVNLLEQQQSFMRAQENDDDFSYMKMILFVSMIIVAVLLTNATNNDTPFVASRALMEVQKTQTQKQIQIPIEDSNKNKTAIVPVSNGLIALNTDDCLNSLMTIGSIPEDTKKSLTTMYQQVRNPQNYLASQEGILLCSVRTPKPLNSGYNKIQSALVRLFLLGSQVKQMLTYSNFILPKMDKNIQINGLYRVSAQIKDISLVNDHHCLL